MNIKTKFSINDTVYFFDPSSNSIKSGKVSLIDITIGSREETVASKKHRGLEKTGKRVISTTMMRYAVVTSKPVQDVLSEDRLFKSKAALLKNIKNR